MSGDEEVAMNRHVGWTMTSAMLLGLLLVGMGCGRGKDDASGNNNSGPTLTSISVSPANGAIFNSGAKITFVASATDPDNNKLSYTWTSDGQSIGSLASMTLTLPSGTHVIRCVVSDGQTTASSEFTIKVKSAPAKATPGFESAFVLGGILVALFFYTRRK